MEIRKILLLSDFNDGVSLLNYGLAMANQLDAQLWVLHAYYIPPNVAGEVFIPGSALEAYEKSIRRTFHKFKSKLSEPDQQRIALMVHYGDLTQSMISLVKKEAIDLVLVGNRGGGFLTNILGSNTIKTIQHAPCAVLSVPENTSFQPFRRIVWAVDLQQVPEGVVEQIAAFTQLFAAQLHIVHVDDKPVDVQKLMASSEASLKAVTHAYFHVVAGHVEEGIEQHIDAHQADLLVLLPRTHSFFDRLFQKSITRQAAYQKKIPLLTLHV